jgi:EAL domain-containing protein (putative c-di-GMP-specific phosphodiesterase class I)/HAMP domain-containing protein
MRFGLRTRFAAILMLVVVVAIAALVVVRSEQQAHDRTVSESVQAMSQQPHGDAQQQASDRIGQADQRYRTALLLAFAAFCSSMAGIALLVWLGLVQPIRRLAHAVRRIEVGDTAAPLADSRRNDEIGDLARAYGAINDAFVAMRSRMDHDAAASRPPSPPTVAAPRSPQPAHVPRPPKAGGTMVMPAGRDADVEQARLAETNRAKWTKEVASPGAVPAAPLSLREQRLEDELREAWQRGEISIVYQPIHALADGGMRGAEAFLRWQHPTEGAVPPAVFIPLAERSDLIDTLGRYVLVQACADASLWPCGSTPEQTPFLSVNVSAKQLHGAQLFESVVEALQRSGLAASRLHLELPVAALRSDDRGIAAMIEQLRGLGVQIWLDVVGADAADQSRWMKLSVTGVKVGRSRIAGKRDDAADAAATGAIVATAHALRVVAVVVGVEELAQLDLLRTQGADLAQGYVLCKPVSTAEIGRRLLA